MKAQFQGSQGQLMFFFGNKGDAALERLIFVVPPAGQFAFQQGAVPPLLEPKKQIQVCCLCTCCGKGGMPLTPAPLKRCTGPHAKEYTTIVIAGI